MFKRMILGMTFAISAAIFATSLVHAAPTRGGCVFGEELQDLDQNPRFKVQDNVIRTFKLSRIDQESRLIMVSVSILKDKRTGRVYHVNTTFRHRDDGDNTIGWIEDVTGAESDSGANGEGQIVATIGDSFFGQCLIRD